MVMPDFTLARRETNGLLLLLLRNDGDGCVLRLLLREGLGVADPLFVQVHEGNDGGFAGVELGLLVGGVH